MNNPFTMLARRDDATRQEGSNAFVRYFAIGILALAAICAAAVSVTSLPFTEGWYETLVYLEKHGFQAYKNIEFVLPPVTLVYFRILDVFTHSNFAANKLLGVVLDLVDVGLLYVWTRRFVSSSAALLAAAMLFVLMSTEPLFIPGDYHQIVLLFLTIATMLLVTPSLYSARGVHSGAILRVGAAGGLTQILLLTKQNVGLGFFVGVMLIFSTMTISGLQRKNRLVVGKAAAFFLAYTAMFIATGWVFLKALYPSSAPVQLYVSFFLIGSKGSPLYAATRLLHDTNNIDNILPAFVITALIVLGSFASKYFREKISNVGLGIQVFNDTAKAAYTFASLLLLAILPIALFITALVYVITSSTSFLWNSWPAIFTFTCYFLDVAFLVMALASSNGSEGEHQARLYNLARVILFGMVIVAHSMTAAVSSIALQLFFGYYAALSIHHALRRSNRAGRTWQGLSLTATFLILGVYFAKLELSKLDIPYSWWGMQEPPIYASSSHLESPYLQGLRVSQDRARMIDSIVATVQSQTQPSDPILVYPDIPLFYMLTNRLPQTQTYVQWFDFATNPKLIPDFLLTSSHPPKVIVEMSVPQAVYVGHESLLGRMVPQRPFTEYLQCMVDSGAYQELNRFFYNRSNALEGTYSLRTSHAISAEGVDEIAALALHYPSATYVVTGALGLDDSILSLPEIQKIADQKSGGFGGIVVKGNSDELPNFLKYLAENARIKLTPADDNFILRTLRLAPNWAYLEQNCPIRLKSALSLLPRDDSGH